VNAAEARALISAARGAELNGEQGELALAFAKVLEAIAYESDRNDSSPADLARAALEA